MTLAAGTRMGHTEHKHLGEECLLLFRSERLYIAAFFCRRPHPVLLASQGTSSSPWPRSEIKLPVQGHVHQLKISGFFLLWESF